MAKKVMKILQNKAIFAVLVVGLVTVGFTIKIPIHPIVEKIFSYEIVKFALLAAIASLGSISIEIALLSAIMYIMFTEQIDNKIIQKVADKSITNDTETEEIEAIKEESS